MVYDYHLYSLTSPCHGVRLPPVLSHKPMSWCTITTCTLSQTHVMMYDYDLYTLTSQCHDVRLPPVLSHKPMSWCMIITCTLSQTHVMCTISTCTLSQTHVMVYDYHLYTLTNPCHDVQLPPVLSHKPMS